jgi:arylsulfatase A-like enzyme
LSLIHYQNRQNAFFASAWWLCSFGFGLLGLVFAFLLVHKPLPHGRLTTVSTTEVDGRPTLDFTLGPLTWRIRGFERDLPAGPIAYDFIAQFKHADAQRESSRIDVGTSDARIHLTRGWSADEEWPGGQTGAWSEGDESWLDFYLQETRALTLVLRGQPYDAGGGRQQVVTVTLNDAPLGTLALSGHRRRYEVVVPRSATREGTNRLRLAYAFTAAPADGHAASRDTRRLAVFWGAVELRGAAESAAPRLQEDTDTLLLPPGTRVDYYLEAPAGATLTLAALAASSGSGLLELGVRTGDAPERVAAALRPGPGIRAVPLGNLAAGPVRVSFTYRGLPSAAGYDAALRLVRPSLRASHAPPPRERAASVARAPGRQPDIFIYLVDALRADRLGCYGYRRGTSPHLDAFAREAVLVERTFAHSSWTKASVASLLTGSTPFRHGVEDRNDALPPGVTTLAQVLRDAGYHTVMVYANTWVGPPWGLDRGFEDVRRLPLARSDRIHREIVKILDASARDARPLFVYVHTIDPHDPYDPPAEQWRRFAAPVTSLRRVSHEDLGRIRGEAEAHPDRQARYARELSALYDAEVAANDEQFGLFVDELRRRARLDRALVLFTADHGEEFFEHGGLGHGQTLFPEVLRVPLVIRFPGGVDRGARLPAARHEDVLPTILEAAGLPVPGTVEGVPIDPSEVSTGRPSLASLRLDGRRLSSWTDGSWHAIWAEKTDEPGPRDLALYDLNATGDEDVAERYPLKVGIARGELRSARWRSGGYLAAEVSPPEEVLRSLRALGYVQ